MKRKKKLILEKHLLVFLDKKLKKPVNCPNNLRENLKNTLNES